MVLRWDRYVKITPERLAGAQRFFARHGAKRCSSRGSSRA